MEQIDVANTTEHAVREFTFVVKPREGEELQLEIDGVRKTLYLLNADGLGYALGRIRAVGKGEIKVSKIPLKQGRLGDWQITFGYGEGKVGDRDALLVLTEKDEGGGQLTVRVRPVDRDSDSGKAA